jgi:hypothetical protein
MAFDFIEAKSTLDEITNISDKYKERLQSSVDRIVEIETALQNMQTKYSGVISAIDDEVTANPGDQAWLNVQLEKDALVSAFIALRNCATDLKTAVEGVSCL